MSCNSVRPLFTINSKYERSALIKCPIKLDIVSIPACVLHKICASVHYIVHSLNVASLGGPAIRTF